MVLVIPLPLLHFAFLCFVIFTRVSGNLNARLLGVSALFNACQDEVEVVGCIRLTRSHFGKKKQLTVIELV